MVKRIKKSTLILCSSRKYPYLPQGRLTEIPRGRGLSKAQCFEGKYMYRGMTLKNLPWKGYGYFLEQNITNKEPG